MTITEAPSPGTQSPTAPITAGWKTSEFWLKIAALVLTALFASGVIPTSGPVAQVAAIAATMLGSLGYTVGRSLVKAAGTTLLLLSLVTLVGTQTACGSTSKSADKEVLGAVVDCAAPDRVKLEAQFGPTVELALQRALGADGKIDLPSLDQIGHNLEADGWCVLEHEAAKLIAWTASKVGTASAAAPLDAEDLAAKVSALRTAKFGATRFQLSGGASSIDTMSPFALAGAEHALCGDWCVDNEQCIGCGICRNGECVYISPKMSPGLAKR